jgi:putative protease
VRDSSFQYSYRRRLLDEGRNATPDDMRALAKIFSRGGFTDGYYKKRIGSDMLGVRSDADKRESAAAEKFCGIERKLPIELYASIRSGKEAELRAVSEGRSVTVKGAIPNTAINAPLTREAVEKNLSKLGATCYSLEKLEIELDEGLMLPVSALNALRRSAVEALETAEERSESDLNRVSFNVPSKQKDRRTSRTALFFDPSQIPDSAESFFDRIFVPLERYSDCVGKGYGVMLPEVVFDSEREEIEKMLSFAASNGAKYALVGNLGHARLARDAGLLLVGDFRLNCYNNSTAAELETAGFEEIILSPELTLAQMRDIGGRARTIVYGRLPLMITEKCVGKELGGCNSCDKQKTALVDRKGVEFPVRRRPQHRSVIFNSVPVYMGDRTDELKAYGISAQHFIFSTESAREIDKIIALYSGRKVPSMNNFTRIKNK